MVLYSEDGMNAFFGGENYRKDSKTGYFLGSIKHEGRRKRLHVAIWEYFNGPVPAGAHIHHVDENKNNNEPTNLILLDGKEHVRLHGRTASQEVKARKAKNLIENAGPKAVEWHKSKAGREWHSEHARIGWLSRKEKTYICSYCGNEFQSMKAYMPGIHSFCSNNCKSAFRRRSGVDSEIRICAKCGTEFVTNKYSKAIYCSRSCARKK